MKNSKLLARIGMIALAVLIFATTVLTAVLGCMYHRDRDVYAVPEFPLEPTYYTVVFNSNGGQFVGSPDSSIQVEAGTTIPSSSIPTVTRAGYTFLGWRAGGGYDDVDLSTYVVTNHVMLYAQWQAVPEPEPEPTYYTVYFDANATTVSWSGSSAVSVVAGSKVSSYSLPTVTSTVGLEFIGWFTLPTGGSEIDWDTYQVTDDVTVFAHWGYKITFNANGGSFANGGSTQSVVFDSDLSGFFPAAEAPDDPLLTDYDFLGWYTDPDGGRLINLSSWAPTGNDTLYAQWQAVPEPEPEPTYYTVVFNSNGGQFVGSPDSSIQVEAGTTIPSSSIPTVTRAGYTFLGWRTGGGVDVDFSTYVVTNHVMLYAQWQAVPEPEPEPTYYTVVFNSNGGQFVGSPDSSIQVEAGTTIPSSLVATVTRVDHTFLGWSTSASGSVISLDSYTVTDDVTLYAQWQAVPEPEPEPTYYTVYFDANATTVSWSGSSAVSVVAGSKVSSSSLPIVTSTVGQEFIGWFTLPTGGSEIDWDTYQVTDDVTVFAHWGYKITFNANGGSFANGGSTQSVVFDSDLSGFFPAAEAPDDPLLTDYDFLGWYTDPDGGRLIKLSSWAPTGNTTLYAHWDLIVVPPDPGDDDSGSGLENPLVFFITPIDAFFGYPIFGTLSIGDILQLVLFVFIGLIFLRMFAGG